MNISDAVSETALLTLKARVLEARRDPPLIEDPVGEQLLIALEQELDSEIRQRILDRKMPRSASCALTLRARRYDEEVRRFRKQHPDGLVVSLGAGFDTRYWRISEAAWNYLEVDLPGVMAAKQQLLGERANYPMIGGSVLETDWLERVRAQQHRHVLLLAEGLLMYLPRPEVTALFGRLAEAFEDSEFLFEVVQEMYTRGMWQKMVERKMRRNMGTRAGTLFTFGIKQGGDVESFAGGIQVLDEWSYLEDPDAQPAMLRLFRNWKFVTRTQWSIRVALN